MREKSAAIYEKACEVIPGGVNSPVRAFKGLETHPVIAESGSGAILRDADGHEYIDFCCSWGSLILGHAHPNIVRGVSEQVAKGSSFGIATEIEQKLASRIVSHIPSIEKLRFVSSGTEATMTALRLARGYTGRTKIVKFAGHYHGHSDGLLIQAGSGVAHLNSIATSKGVNPNTIADTICLPFNNLDALRAFFQSDLAEETAAVILEPVTANMGVVLPIPGFLETLREETTRTGSLLIFDEVVTGFRLGLTGAQGIYGITPDLTCLGKIIGGGFPVAAFGGPAKILDHMAPLGQVYQAGTLSGNPVAMRAGLETMAIIEQPSFYKELQAKTDRLTVPLRKALENKPARLVQKGSMFNLFFDEPKMFVPFFNYMLKEGVYISPSANEAWFMSSAHTNEQLDRTLGIISNFFESSNF